MTDIIAEPAAQAAQQVIPAGMSFNPLLDWAPLLSVPLWVFITIVLIVGFILVVIYYVRKIKRLDSVKGWLESLKKITQRDVQVWVISRIQRLTIECMTIEDNVITPHDQTLIEMWHHNSNMARIIVGGNPGVVVSEDYHHTRDFISEIALTHNCDEFNANQEKLKGEYVGGIDAQTNQLVEPKNKGAVVKPITDFPSYDGFGRICLLKLHPNGLPYPSYSIFNPTRFRKYFPLGNSAKHFGGDLIEGSRGFRIRRKDPGFWEKHTIFIMCSIIALALVGASWLFPMGA